MIEKDIFDFLSAKLNIPVFMETPINAPATYVLIEKTGSGQTNRLNTAMIIVQSYATSLYNASLLNESVKDAILGTDDDAGLAGSNVVIGVTLNTDYNFTDTETKRYRYQAVFDITF